MRVLFLSLMTVFLVLSYIPHANAQTSASSTFTANLSLGSRGAQVVALQKILNSDPDTRIANSGPGSPGHETSYFGLLTKASVVRFQAKYANEVLTPIGLTRGNGRVGFYTRMKLNTLSSSQTSTKNMNPQVTPPIATSTPNTKISTTSVSSLADYLVKNTEKIDIYAGDKMIENIQNKITSAINAAINSAITTQRVTTATIPVMSPSDAPSVAIKDLSPRSGTPGTRVTLSGIGISSNSTVYLGNTYIIRTINQDALGNFSFIIPPIPVGRYDLAINTDDSVSATTYFVITDPKNPVVLLENVSPSNIQYGDTLILNGSGFSPVHNTVVTTFQKFTDVLSVDGKTISIRFAPEALQEQSKISKGTLSVPVSLYVVNEYGFSDTEKTFTMNL